MMRGNSAIKLCSNIREIIREHGCLKFRDANTKLKFLLLVALLIALAGCGGAAATSTKEALPPEELAKAEASFRPSDYDKDPASIKAADEKTPAKTADTTV